MKWTSVVLLSGLFSSQLLAVVVLPHGGVELRNPGAASEQAQPYVKASKRLYCDELIDKAKEYPKERMRKAQKDLADAKKELGKVNKMLASEVLTAEEATAAKKALKKAENNLIRANATIEYLNTNPKLVFSNIDVSLNTDLRNELTANYAKNPYSDYISRFIQTQLIFTELPSAKHLEELDINIAYKYPGFITKEGEFIQYRTTKFANKDAEDEDTDDALATVFRGPMESVVAIAVCQIDGQLYQILHRHNEEKEWFGFEQHFVSAPAGKGTTGWHALQEFHEETNFFFIDNAIRLLAVHDEEKMRLRYVFMQVDLSKEQLEKAEKKEDTFILAATNATVSDSKVFTSFDLRINPNEPKDPTAVKDMRIFLEPRPVGLFDAEVVFAAPIHLNKKIPAALEGLTAEQQAPFATYVDGSVFATKEQVLEDRKRATSVKGGREPELFSLGRFNGFKKDEVYGVIAKLEETIRDWSDVENYQEEDVEASSNDEDNASADATPNNEKKDFRALLDSNFSSPYAENNRQVIATGVTLSAIVAVLWRYGYFASIWK